MDEERRRAHRNNARTGRPVVRGVDNALRAGRADERDVLCAK
jgi:hypothetical protein